MATSRLCVFMGNWHSLRGGINRSSMFSYCPAVCPLWHHDSLLTVREIQTVWRTRINIVKGRSLCLSKVQGLRTGHKGTSETEFMLWSNETDRHGGGGGIRTGRQLAIKEGMNKEGQSKSRSVSVPCWKAIYQVLFISFYTCTCNQMYLTVLRIVPALLRNFSGSFGYWYYAVALI